MIDMVTYTYNMREKQHISTLKYIFKEWLNTVLIRHCVHWHRNVYLVLVYFWSHATISYGATSRYTANVKNKNTTKAASCRYIANDYKKKDYTYSYYRSLRIWIKLNVIIEIWAINRSCVFHIPARAVYMSGYI